MPQQNCRWQLQLKVETPTQCIPTRGFTYRALYCYQLLSYEYIGETLLLPTATARDSSTVVNVKVALGDIQRVVLLLELCQYLPQIRLKIQEYKSFKIFHFSVMFVLIRTGDMHALQFVSFICIIYIKNEFC